jgi:hypothetical protein
MVDQSANPARDIFECFTRRWDVSIRVLLVSGLPRLWSWILSGYGDHSNCNQRNVSEIREEEGLLSSENEDVNPEHVRSKKEEGQKVKCPTRGWIKPLFPLTR